MFHSGNGNHCNSNYPDLQPVKVIHYNRNSEKEIFESLLRLCRQNGYKNLRIDYFRKDNRTFKTVYFKVFLVALVDEQTQHEIMRLPDFQRERLNDMIAFVTTFCRGNSFSLENKFANDGYSYKGLTISRQINRP
jgi:hypothetical protein